MSSAFCSCSLPFAVYPVRHLRRRPAPPNTKECCGTSPEPAVAERHPNRDVGWDTIYDPKIRRPPSSRPSPPSAASGASAGAATSSSIGTPSSPPRSPPSAAATWPTPTPSKPCEATPAGFVPNYARAGRLEKQRPLRAARRRHHRPRPLPQFHDRWLLADTFPALLALEPLVG
jgi:hypothetical protein